MHEPRTIAAVAAPSATRRRYHGWRVVVAAFLIALFGWGLGFYGPGIYLVALAARTGWPLDTMTPAVTVYYLIGGSLILVVARAFARFGPRFVVAGGAVAMGLGVTLLGQVAATWQVYGAFAVMAVGWAAMSGAAVNIIVAPWFAWRRGTAVSLALNGASAGGTAVSLALNGASAGGIVMAPLLVLLIERWSLTVALGVAAAAMLALVLPVAVLVLRPRRADEAEPGAPADPAPVAGAAAAGTAAWPVARLLRHPGFLTIAGPFAAGLLVQVGFLTHQVAYLEPILGPVGAGWAVSATAVAAVVGRLGAGTFIDRVDRRLAAGANMLMQVVALALMLAAPSPLMVVAACVLFGLGVGNLITLSGLIVQQEFPAAEFARLIALMTAIAQFTFAFGPALIGALRTSDGSYSTALAVCLAIHATAALVVVAPAVLRRRCAASAASSNLL